MFINTTEHFVEPETDKEDSDSEQEDNPTTQEIEVCNPNDSDSDDLPDVESLRVCPKKVPAGKRRVPPTESQETSQRCPVGRPKKDAPKPVSKEQVPKRKVGRLKKICPKKDANQ